MISVVEPKNLVGFVVNSFDKKINEMAIPSRGSPSKIINCSMCHGDVIAGYAAQAVGSCTSCREHANYGDCYSCGNFCIPPSLDNIRSNCLYCKLVDAEASGITDTTTVSPMTTSAPINDYTCRSCNSLVSSRDDTGNNSFTGDGLRYRSRSGSKNA